MSHVNDARIKEVLELRARRRPTNAERLAGPTQPGDTVTHAGAIGVIDAAFFDLRAAVENGVVDPTWYAEQDTKPKTLPHQRWYSVILPHGAVLLGEEDL